MKWQEELLTDYQQYRIDKSMKDFQSATEFIQQEISKVLVNVEPRFYERKRVSCSIGNTKINFTIPNQDAYSNIKEDWLSIVKQSHKNEQPFYEKVKIKLGDNSVIDFGDGNVSKTSEDSIGQLLKFLLHDSFK